MTGDIFVVVYFRLLFCTFPWWTFKAFTRKKKHLQNFKRYIAVCLHSECAKIAYVCVLLCYAILNWSGATQSQCVRVYLENVRV